jgi:hypothetical protein
MDIYVFIFLISAGLFSMAGALFNWDFFLESQKASVFMRMLGRNGTRILYYFVLGLTILTIAVLVQLGILESK